MSTIGSAHLLPFLGKITVHRNSSKRHILPVAILACSLVATLTCVPTSQAQISAAKPNVVHDRFYWVNEENKASLIMLHEQQIIPKKLAAAIGRAIQQVEATAAVPGKPRSGNYLELEKDLIALVGPDASRLHSGRSRQDMGATARRAEMREAFLETFERFVAARQSLLQLARSNPDAVLPFYTHAVQAQPITLGHYLGGYLQAFTRQSERYQQAYARINLSPFGTAAGGTSSFPLDRQRLSDLMGFSKIMENSFDGDQISLQDMGSDAVSSTASGTLIVSMLTADLLTQYGNPYPWFFLGEGDQTGRSSIMPQKRNPSALEELQEASGLVTGLTTTYYVLAQNVPSGLDSYKKTPIPFNVVASAAVVYERMKKMLDVLQFRSEHALDRLNADYSVMTELADVLQRESDVPFRVGHHFASELVNYGRTHKLGPAQLPYSEAQKIFSAALKDAGLPVKPLPLAEARFRQVLTPENMVRSAKPTGGPQPAEVARMLKVEESSLQNDRRWLAEQRASLEAAGKLRSNLLHKLVSEQ